jgi:hypothetical protein
MLNKIGRAVNNLCKYVNNHQLQLRTVILLYQLTQTAAENEGKSASEFLGEALLAECRKILNCLNDAASKKMIAPQCKEFSCNYDNAFESFEDQTCSAGELVPKALEDCVDYLCNRIPKLLYNSSIIGQITNAISCADDFCGIMGLGAPSNHAEL